MKMLRFRNEGEEAWTFCSFAGEAEADAYEMLAGRLIEVYTEVQGTDDESEDWLAVGGEE